jgi:hypothetical protein
MRAQKTGHENALFFLFRGGLKASVGNVYKGFLSRFEGDSFLWSG